MNGINFVIDDPVFISLQICLWIFESRYFSFVIKLLHVLCMIALSMIVSHLIYDALQLTEEERLVVEFLIR